MPELITRAADRAHRGLVGTAERLAAGHQVLVGKAALLLVRRPAQTAPDAQEAPPVEKPKAKKETAQKSKTKAAPELSAKDTEAAEEEGAPENGKTAGKDAKTKKEKAPPAHTAYRPGPRRMIAAAAHWTVDGEGAWDFVIRAGLLAGGIGIVGYFARPLLLSLTSIHPAWLGVLFVILLAVELAPTLAALLLLGLTAALTSPALMWPAAIVWAVAAWVAGAPSKEVEEAAPEPLPEEVDEELPDTPAQALARWLCLIIGNRGGIHLRELYPAMRNLPGQEHRPDAALRALLRAFDIPVQRSIRVGGIGGRSGVYLADVQALLSPRGELDGEFDEDAGQSVDSSPLSTVKSGVESDGEGFSDLFCDFYPTPRLTANGHTPPVTACTYEKSTL